MLVQAEAANPDTNSRGGGVLGDPSNCLMANTGGAGLRDHVELTVVGSRTVEEPSF